MAESHMNKICGAEVQMVMVNVWFFSVTEVEGHLHVGCQQSAER